MLDGRSEPVGVAMVAERDHLLARAPEGFDLADVTFPLVDKQSCVLVKTNAYSVPVKGGSRVEARVYPLHVEVWHSGRLIARHERCHRRRQQVLDLEHYPSARTSSPREQIHTGSAARRPSARRRRPNTTTHEGG